MPLHTFQSGQIFDTAFYQPRTVVLFRQEYLYGPSVEGDYDVDALREQGLPPRSTVTSPSFGLNAPGTVAEDGKRHYVSNIWRGIVPRVNQANHLLTISAAFVLERGVGARAISSFASIHAPIKIGESMHYRERPDINEVLHRVNVLHLMAYGTPERQRNKLFSLLGRPALGNG